MRDTCIALTTAYKSLNVLEPLAPLCIFVLAYFCGFTWESDGGKQMNLRNLCSIYGFLPGTFLKDPLYRKI